MFDVKALASSQSLWKIGGIVAVLAIWQLAATIVGLGSTFPSVTETVPVFWSLVASGDVFGPTAETVYRTLLGFAIGFLGGALYGVLSFASKKFAAYTRLLHTAALFTPSLIVIFIGLLMFKRTQLSVIVIIAFCIFAEVGVYFRDAFSGFDQSLSDMCDAYMISSRARVVGVYVPFLAPAILTTTRLGFTLAWKVSFLAEAFGFPGGLGYMVRQSFNIFDIPSLMAWLLAFVIVLVIVEEAIRLVERSWIRWR